jgi:hypothetical protein
LSESFSHIFQEFSGEFAVDGVSARGLSIQDFAQEIVVGPDALCYIGSQHDDIVFRNFLEETVDHLVRLVLWECEFEIVF